MKAVTWHGKRDVRVDNVPDPTIQESNDAIVRITTTAICTSTRCSARSWERVTSSAMNPWGS